MQLPPNCAPGVALWLPPERPAYPFNLLCRLITVSLETMRIVRASLLDILDKQFAKISIRCRARSSMNVHRVDPARMH